MNKKRAGKGEDISKIKLRNMAVLRVQSASKTAVRKGWGRLWNILSTSAQLACRLYSLYPFFAECARNECLYDRSCHLSALCYLLACFNKRILGRILMTFLRRVCHLRLHQTRTFYVALEVLTVVIVLCITKKVGGLLPKYTSL